MRLKAGIGLLLLIAFPALAAEEDNFATLYLQVPAQYVRPMTTEDAAVNVLKGLTAADARLRVGDDAERVSLYYHGRLLKILRKPVNKDDITNIANYIFINNKSLLNCDIKIDDRLDNLQNAKIKLLFTAYHNKGLDDEYLHSLGVIRVNNWLEIKKILARELNDESGSAAQ